MVSTGLRDRGSGGHGPLPPAVTASAQERERGLEQLVRVPFRTREPRGGGGLDLMSEPGALALRELAGAEAHPRLGRGAREPTVEQRQSLVVAHRAPALARRA